MTSVPTGALQHAICVASLFNTVKGEQVGPTGVTSGFPCAMLLESTFLAQDN